MKKKILSILLATAMVATLAGCGGDNADNNNGGGSTGGTTPAGGNETASNGGESTDVTVDKIEFWIDGTLAATQENGQAEFEKQWEDAVGVDLVINQLDHNSYKETVQRLLTAGEKPDILLMSAEMYKSYAALTNEDGSSYLWDMTDAYENADFYSRITATSTNELLKINGRLYGFAPAYGNGCITYVKKSWLDAVGMSADDIKTFDHHGS